MNSKSVDEMLEYNREFVADQSYLRNSAGKRPRRKIAILTCMDTRLVRLLPAALGIRDGDVKMIKNAGALVTGPLDSTVRSLLIGIVELGVQEVMVIGHTDCGVGGLNAETMLRDLKARGVSQEKIDYMRELGVDYEAWFGGFDAVEVAVAQTVETLRSHPLMPADVVICGYVMDTETGQLTPLECD
jgi:carbonic anhydrase